MEGKYIIAQRKRKAYPQHDGLADAPLPRLTVHRCVWV